MKSKGLKYIALVVFGILFIKDYFPLGDYCRGLLGAFKFIIYGSLFLLLFLILSISNAIQFFKKKAKFDFLLVLIFLFFVITESLLMKLDHKKFWLKSICEGSIQFENRPQSGVLFLYKNSTFEATHNYADFSCTYVGEYEINQDTLLLLRNTITLDTDSLFTNKYKFNRHKNKLIPFTNKFKIIQGNLIK